MQNSTSVLVGKEHIERAVRDSITWCENAFAAVSSPAADPEHELWSLLLEDNKFVSARVHPTSSANPDLMRRLQRSGQLRLAGAPSAPPANVLWFRAGPLWRVFVACATFAEVDWSSAPAPWVLFAGETSELPTTLVGLLQSLQTDSVTPLDTHIEQLLAQQEPKVPTHRREIRSVRDVLGAGELSASQDWFGLDESSQALAIWSALLGDGTLEMEEAVRTAAHRLRAQGLVEYQALRQRGPLYQALEERVRSARRQGELFDRPRPGYVRAIAKQVESFAAEDWRDCLMCALQSERRVERSQATRLAFDYARDIYGLDAQRLRGGGRAERAIKSAINSSIRQGLLERDGAMYLIRAADIAEPIQRGKPESSSEVGSHSDVPPSESMPDATPAPADAIPTPPNGTPPPNLLQQLVHEVHTPSAMLPHGPLAPLSRVDRPTPSAPQASVASPLAQTPPSSVSDDAPVAGARPVEELSLAELEFPTRTLNWAEQHGIRTLGGLIAWNPSEFLSQRNLGHLTAKKTRAALEEALGCTWEDAWQANQQQVPLHARAPEQDEETVTRTMGWGEVFRQLSQEDRAIPLAELELPTRIRNFIQEEGLMTVEELLRLSYDELRAKPNLGRKSLSDTLDALADTLAERQNPTQYDGFMDMWRAELSALKPMHRLILSRRAGLHGPIETLEDLGSMLGISRERVRQIEARVVERLKDKTRWKRDVPKHLDRAFGGARAVSLDLLDEEPWWRSIANNVRLLEFTFERLLGAAFVFTAPSGAVFVTKFAPSEFSEAVEDVKARLAALQFPVSYERVVDFLTEACGRLDMALFEEIEAQVNDLLHRADDGSVIGFGAGRGSEVIAFLGAQPQPVHISVLEDRFGRGHLPDEVLYFKRGVVGLKKHFHDFEQWMARIVPQCIEQMEERALGRQWLVTELHETLLERRQLPEWLGHWHLASLLRHSGQVQYLGRLRVALQGSASERLQFEDLFHQLLDEAGKPLPKDELIALARQQTDVQETTADLMLREAPFVRLDKTLVGLLERDVPGGPEAVAVAIAAVSEQLERTAKGLTPHQATQLVQGASPEHHHWSRPLVLSLLRNEASIRIDRSKNIGLADWDDARCPTRVEFIRRGVTRSGGRIGVAELSRQMKEFYGNEPDRVALNLLANQAGLSLRGDEVSRGDTASEPPISKVVAQLTGIPAELRQLFEELCEKPLQQPSALASLVDEHLATFEREERVNEFVDLESARTLTAHCHSLLSRWPLLSPADQHIAQAAIQYFALKDDHTEDFEVGGLDDDNDLMHAVLEHLGLTGNSDAIAAN